jgi:hypothetical protein
MLRCRYSQVMVRPGTGIWHTDVLTGTTLNTFDDSPNERDRHP